MHETRDGQRSPYSGRLLSCIGHACNDETDLYGKHRVADAGGEDGDLATGGRHTRGKIRRTFPQVRAHLLAEALRPRKRTGGWTRAGVSTFSRYQPVPGAYDQFLQAATVSRVVPVHELTEVRKIRPRGSERDDRFCGLHCSSGVTAAWNYELFTSIGARHQLPSDNSKR